MNMFNPVGEKGWKVDNLILHGDKGLLYSLAFLLSWFTFIVSLQQTKIFPLNKSVSDMHGIHSYIAAVPVYNIFSYLFLIIFQPQIVILMKIYYESKIQFFLLCMFIQPKKIFDGQEKQDGALSWANNIEFLFKFATWIHIPTVFFFSKKCCTIVIKTEVHIIFFLSWVYGWTQYNFLVSGVHLGAKGLAIMPNGAGPLFNQSHNKDRISLFHAHDTTRLESRGLMACLG
ncbi:hypothetical protein ACJX0J_039734, partial [Zea mays]